MKITSIKLKQVTNYVNSILESLFPYDRCISKPMRGLIVLNHAIMGLNLNK